MTTFVLIPGAGGDSWEWHLLVRELEARGHETIAVTLPAGDESAGWDDYADAVVEAIGDRREDLVLVAQSLGGFTAPLVAERVSVRMIVLLNAMIPLPGETGNAWWTNTDSKTDADAYAESIGLPKGATDDDRVVYFHDVPQPIVDQSYSRGEPSQSMTPMEQPFALSGWPDVPTRVVAGRDDRLFPASFQRRLAEGRHGLMRAVFHEATSGKPAALVGVRPVLGPALRALAEYMGGQMSAGRLRRMDPFLALQAFIGPIYFHLMTGPVAAEIVERHMGVDEAVDELVGAVLAGIAA